MKDGIKFNILRDEPLDQKESDRFGYIDIADIIADIIKKAKPPFTIGLYGKWGSGKTSICKLVEKNINNISKKSDFKTFYFDTWKYEQDSFRRQFLIELDEKLDLRLNFKATLNQSLTKPIHLTLKELFCLIFDNLLLRIIVILIFIVIALQVLTFFVKITNIPFDYSQLLAALSSLGIVGAFISFLLRSFEILHGSIQTYRTDSAEGFEDRFNEALKKLNDKKLLIIIDNLDRLEHRKAVNVLSDIKTFLAKERENNAIFLIPCDNEAITDHLHNIFGDNFDAEEFLRKFFNLTFKIPKLLDVELDEYILAKLKETEIAEFQGNLTLSFVIMQAFRDNPREIIQFINSLITSYLLAVKRNLSEVVNNIAFLARILVVRQKWSQEYAKIENKILRTGLKLNEVLRYFDNENPRDLRDFLEITSSIDATNHDVFFSLHMSDQERSLTEWTSFILSAEEKRIDDLEKVYETIKNNNRIRELNRLLIDYIRKNQENKTKIVNVFISFSNILTPQKRESFEDFKEPLSHFFNVLDDPSIFINSINEINFRNLIHKTISQIVPNEFFNKFLATLVRALTSTKDSNHPAIEIDKGIELLELLSQDSIWARLKNHSNSLEDAKNRFIQVVNVNDIINLPNKTERIQKISDFILKIRPITDRVFPTSINKIVEIINHSSMGEDIWQVFECALQLLNEIQHPRSPDSSYITSIQNLSNAVIGRYNQTSDWFRRKILIKIVLSLLDFDGNSWRSQLLDCIRNFIGDINNNEINITNTISRKQFIKLLENEPSIKEAFLTRSQISPDILISYDFRNYLTEQEIQNIMQSLISRHESFINFLQYMKFKITDSMRQWTVQSMINIINSVEDQIFDKWLISIVRLKITDYPDRISDFYNQLKSAKSRGESFNEKIKVFVKKNKKIFAEAQAGDLLN